MLTRFEVTNFKSFKENFVFDFTNTSDYQFNPECIKNGIVNKGMIYGANGSGKSNLGFAIFDIVSRLTDKDCEKSFYKHYLNAFGKNKLAEFKYVFSFEKDIVEYSYGKYNIEIFAYEELKINNETVISLDRRVTKKAIVTLKGAEKLNTDVGDSDISIVNYVKKNTILKKSFKNNKLFNRFIKYIEGMLFFRALDTNTYLGFEKGSSRIDVDIIEHGNVENFEAFLNTAGVECNLTVVDRNGEPDLAFSFDGNTINFFEIASTGTRSLSLFYFWLQRLKENNQVSFVFIDEFDAFYHHELSEFIIKELKEIDAQVVLTTHNTSIMSNDLLRPDCYFLMNKEEIKPLNKCTEKELRFAHNIEKIYRADGFHV